MAEVALIILDRIFKIPNEWTKVLTPLVIWLSRHTDDKLVEIVFNLNPVLN